MYPSVALNVPLSIYPVGAGHPAAQVAGHRRLLGAGRRVRRRPAERGPQPQQPAPRNEPGPGAFATAELAYDYRKDGVVVGSYKLGGFYHNGRFPALTDPAQSFRGNRGVYLCAGHLVWREKAEGEEGLGAFLQTGGAPGNQNLVNFYLSSGLSYRGLLPERGDDELGFGLVHSALNADWVAAGESGRYAARTLLEVNYKAQLGKYFRCSPTCSTSSTPVPSAPPPTPSSACCGARWPTKCLKNPLSVIPSSF
jgi:porin